MSDDVIEHTIPSDFLHSHDTDYLSSLGREYLESLGIKSDAFAFAVQIITPIGKEYEPSSSDN